MNDMKANEYARFDAKISVSHKRLLEEAASLKGFKNLTEYIMTTVISDATEVVEHFGRIIYSVDDKRKIMEILRESTELSTSFLKASQSRKEKLANDVSNS